MEEQNSILLQKKMILTMSMVIFTLTISLACVKNGFSISKTVALNEHKASLVTVEKQDSIEENDIILIEQIAYTASKEIIETDETVLNDQDENQNIEKTEEKVETKKEDTEKNINYKTYRDLAEDNPPTEYSKKLEATATAYCLCKKCCGKSPSSPGYGYTASGIKIVPGTGMKAIAVDPNVIPLGTNVYIEGLYGAWDYGYTVAADTGSAIKNMKIDLYMDTHEECLAWGRKQVNIYVMN